MATTQEPQFLTRVVAACDANLHGQPELLAIVQDYLLPLLELGPAVAQRHGGTRLLSLWLDIATFQGAGIDEYTGAALFTAIQQSGAAFLDRALQANVDSEVWTSVANFALRNNDRSLLQLLHERLPNLYAPNALDIAADVGDIELVKWVLVSRFGKAEMTEKVLCRAAGKGNLAVIEWLVEFGNLPEKDTMVRRAMDYAAKDGQFEVLQWLRDHTEYWWSQHAIGAALVNGHFEIADWMNELNVERHETTTYNCWDPDAPVMALSAVLHDAFAKGNLQILDWLREREYLDPSKKLIDKAMKAGHVHILEYLKEHYPGDCDNLCYSPPCATGGSIEVAQWIHVNGTLPNSATIVFTAAKHGHVDFMRWYWTLFQGEVARTYDGVALNVVSGRGHLECTRFLIEHDLCKANPDALLSAAVNGHIAVAQWLLEMIQQAKANDPEKHEEDTEREDRWLARCLADAMNQASTNGHLDVVKWIYGMQSFLVAPKTIVTAAERGHTDVVHFLIKHAPDSCDPLRAATGAAKSGHLRIVKFLLSHFPQSSANCKWIAQEARSNGHYHIARWIEKYGIEHQK